MGSLHERSATWASTSRGVPGEDGFVSAHAGPISSKVDPRLRSREAREAEQEERLATGATRAAGAGRRARAEEPDPHRTCFERDRDRILHSTGFRRLAGKTQVFVFPADHQRTRLTHALEVTQVAAAIAATVGLNVDLVTAQGLAHDVGHTPGGHSGEPALETFVPDFHHAVWGADVSLEPLNLCEETLDGVRCHSWSLPSPRTPEGQVLSWADRIAYCTHDFEDAVRAGIVHENELPRSVLEVTGRTRTSQIDSFIAAVVEAVLTTGRIGMRADAAEALALMRDFNYERIYMRPESVAQGEAVVAVLRALVEYYADDPSRIPSDNFPDEQPLRRAVAYVAGMTDRFAFESAVELLGWRRDRLPRGIDSPYQGTFTPTMG